MRFKLLGTCSSCELLSLTMGNGGMLVPKCTWDSATSQFQFWEREGVL